jgi:hypothetical protein
MAGLPWVGLAAPAARWPLAALALLVLTLWRLTAGHARDHPLAPATAAALVGFLVVGLFDSLLDMPRVAFAFYLLLGAALVLPAAANASRKASPPPA